MNFLSSVSILETCRWKPSSVHLSDPFRRVTQREGKSDNTTEIRSWHRRCELILPPRNEVSPGPADWALTAGCVGGRKPSNAAAAGRAATLSRFPGHGISHAAERAFPSHPATQPPSRGLGLQAPLHWRPFLANHALLSSPESSIFLALLLGLQQLLREGGH